MEKSLEFRIIFITMSIVIIILFVTYAIDYTISKKMLTDDFSEKAQRIVNQYNERTIMYLKTVEATTSNIANNAIIRNALEKNTLDVNVISVLNGVFNSSNMIIGMSVYSLDTNTIYKTNSVSEPPPLSHLMQNDIPNDFLASGEKCISTIRRDSISGYYPTYFIQSNDGLLTYIEKIFDSNQNVVGILITDISLKDFLNLYTNDSAFTKVLDIFIKTSEGEYPGSNNALSSNDYKKIPHVYCSQQISTDGSRIEVFIPLFSPNTQLRQEVPKTVSFSIIILLVCYLGVVLLAKSIIVPIEELRRIVKKDIITNSN